MRQEFFALPAVVEDLARDPDKWEDGSDAWYTGQCVTKGWELVRRAGPRLQQELAYVLPTYMGLGHVNAEELSTMPVEVLRCLTYRRNPPDDIARLMQMIRDHPDGFPQEAVDSVRRADEHQMPGKDVERFAIKASVARSEVMLDALLKLQEQVAELGEVVRDSQDAGTRKRGFFS